MPGPADLKGSSAIGSRRDRIAFLSTFPPEPLDSGFAIRIHGILRELTQRFDVLLVYPDRQGIEFPPDVHIELQKFPRILEAASLTPSIVLPFSRGVINSSARTSIEQFNPDLTVVSGLHMFPLAGTCKPVLYDAHNIEWHLARDLYIRGGGGLLKGLHRWLTMVKLRAWERARIRECNALVSCSKTDSAYFSSLRNEAVPVVFNAVDIGYWDIDREELKGGILFMGSMGYYPNIHAARFLAEKIMPLVHRQLPEAFAIIAGDAPGPETKRLATDRIQVTGRVPDLRQYLSDAEVFVAPLHVGSGTPLKIMSAMAAGVPVITTNRVARSLGLEPGQGLLCAETAEEYASIIVVLHGDSERRTALSMEGKKVARERFNWDDLGRNFSDRIERFLQVSPSRSC